MATLCACDTAAPPPATPVPETLRAVRIEQVTRLHLAAGDCDRVLPGNLQGHGLSLHRSGPVDASLKVSLRHKRPLREHLPVIGTLGWQAYYRADVIGADRRVLLSLYGQEGSLSFRELCDDIGDEIAAKLKEYLPTGD